MEQRALHEGGQTSSWFLFWCSAHCPTLLPRSTLRHLLHFSTRTSGNGWTEWAQGCLEAGLPGGRALTQLAMTLWPCRWAAAGLARACCVSPPQLTDGEVEHFLILQEEEV